LFFFSHQYAVSASHLGELGYWSSPISQRHQSYRINGYKVGIVYEGKIDVNLYRNTMTHELGHALGWFGHSGNASDIMYSARSTKTTISTRDARHLSQIYSY